ncbi:MAG: gliding motility-associated C-terminal domain-containing protein, partial [Flavobacteriales bacterium]
IISSHNSEAQTDSISVNMNTNGWVTAMKVDVYGCSRKSSDTVFVELQEKPDNGKIKAEDTVLDVDEIVNLIYTGESGNYKWNLGNGKTASGKSIQVIYSKKGKYIATMTTGKNGCKFIDSLQLKVIDNFKLPNVFSPNNDGMNDVYKVTADAFSNYNIIIKNRWGQTIYSHKKGEPFWNGKTKAGNKADEGTYFVVFEGVRKGEKVVRKSDLTLLR